MKLKKSIFIVFLLFQGILFSQNVAFTDSSFTIQKFDSLINLYTNTYKGIIKIRPDSALAKIKRDKYETTEEYNKRWNETLKTFGEYKAKKLKDFFDYYNKTIQLIIEVDSVQYNPDTQIAKVFPAVIKIPNIKGKPFLNIYAAPVFEYPSKWSAKEGFGIRFKPMKVDLNLARTNDVINNKGEILLYIKLFNDNGMIAARLLKAEWFVNENILMNWFGNATIPLDIYKKPLKAGY